MEKRTDPLMAAVAVVVSGFALGGLIESCRAQASRAPLAWTRVLATSFTHMTGPDAKWNGSGFFCAKKPGTNRWAAPGTPGYRYVRMNGHEVCTAHRTLPCGTPVSIRHKGRTVTVPVCDRGPYWAAPVTCQPRWRYACWKKGKPMVRLRKGYYYLNTLDISRAAAHWLRFDGLGAVEYRTGQRHRGLVHAEAQRGSN